MSRIENATGQRYEWDAPDAGVTPSPINIVQDENEPPAPSVFDDKKPSMPFALLAANVNTRQAEETAPDRPKLQENHLARLLKDNPPNARPSDATEQQADDDTSPSLQRIDNASSFGEQPSGNSMGNWGFAALAFVVFILAKPEQAGKLWSKVTAQKGVTNPVKAFFKAWQQNFKAAGLKTEMDAWFANNQNIKETFKFLHANGYTTREAIAEMQERKLLPAANKKSIITILMELNKNGDIPDTFEIVRKTKSDRSPVVTIKSIKEEREIRLKNQTELIREAKELSPRKRRKAKAIISRHKSTASSQQVLKALTTKGVGDLEKGEALKLMKDEGLNLPVQKNVPEAEDIAQKAFMRQRKLMDDSRPLTFKQRIMVDFFILKERKNLDPKQMVKALTNKLYLNLEEGQALKRMQDLGVPLPTPDPKLNLGQSVMNFYRSYFMTDWSLLPS
jgi:hypothetical protein